jgi:BirA family biotin operon repressor/biotin-[acetyl-CoA-carboxylase] ligase
VSWFGATGDQLAAALGLPRVVARDEVGSTMDVAHELAAIGAPAGTLVVAEAQATGRGRGGNAWRSEPGRGIWMTLLERPRASDAIDVLSLRVGLRLAPVLERWTGAPVRLKWPNDLFVGARKLGGVLIEARWRGDRADWVAIGVGVNLVPPGDAPALTGLGPADPLAVLAEMVPAVRSAAFASGALTVEELEAFAERDHAVGRRASEPAAGIVRGITAAGELLLEAATGTVAFRTGSLVLADRPTPPSVPEVPHAARR